MREACLLAVLYHEPWGPEKMFTLFWQQVAGDGEHACLGHIVDANVLSVFLLSLGLNCFARRGVLDGRLLLIRRLVYTSHDTGGYHYWRNTRSIAFNLWPEGELTQQLGTTRQAQ